MRPFPLLLAAALLTVAPPAGLLAADPSPPAEAAAATTSPSAASPDSTTPAENQAPAETTAPAPSAESTAAETSQTAAPAEPAPVAETSAAASPAPQVITAQIDPELALRLSLLEKTMLAQSHGQAAIYAETTRLLMFFGSACVAMGLIAMVAAVFLMNRTLASVSSITAQVAQAHGPVPSLPGPAALVPAGAQPSGFEKVQASGQRFQSRMTSLEQRLEELEHLAGHSSPAPKPSDKAPAEETASTEAAPEEPPAPRRVIPVAAILVRKSETLLNLGKLDEAMAALDEAAKHDGDPAEIHLARGRVLEKLGRLGDALQSYDLAVSNDQTNTAALLMKAGVLNRQERFDEALGCYERALALHRANT